MRRLSKVIASALLASTVVVVLAVAASGAPSSAACLPAGARALAADGTVQAFSWHGAVYGCVKASGARQRLGGASVCNVAPGRVAPVTVARALVVYGLETCGVDTGSSVVVVRNLMSGRRLADLTAATLPRGPESYVSVNSLVVRGDGAVGWISSDASIISHRPTTYEVHRFTSGKSSLLDSGTAIDPASLRLAGARMTWRNRGGKRSAGLP
ncbi:MAG TPA: hypothetical protein VG295_13550 [Solirubrobacteraceae bacterium]|jgi:hypothetical protein|nr:hypothetical protein [Solirubrobacteraceae bacterium]